MIKLLSWNVNGLRAVHKKRSIHEIFKESPDVLCVQETKMQPEQMPADLAEDLKDYQQYFSSAERKGYSGVATFTKLNSLSEKYGFGIDIFDTEGRILINEFEAFTLFNIYYPNGKASKERLQYKMDFYDAFLDNVNKVSSSGRHVVICGDVNTAHKEIDLARPKENENTSGFLPIEREWIDRFLAAGYVDTLRMFNQEPEQYSWWDMKTRARERNIGWRIDYFYVNEEFSDKVKDAFILPEYEGSDHCPIGIILDV